LTCAVVIYIAACSSCHRHTPLSFTRHPRTPCIYSLSLHDALPISSRYLKAICLRIKAKQPQTDDKDHLTMQLSLTELRTYRVVSDRKSTRLNSSHVKNSYAVFCLKKKNKKIKAEEGNSRKAGK